MDLKNKTKDQHFVSRVELRFNAINSNASEKNQKVYSFSLKDRETYSIHLDSESGFKINKTLSYIDIFSFDVLESGAERYNFEDLFQRYEEDIKANTERLISKISNNDHEIKSEILNIFCSKFLNFVRNPFSIKKVINTFPMLRNMYPTDTVHYNNLKRVLNGKKPHQTHLCNQLGISERDYADWLAIIFLLLTPLEENQSNFLEQIIKNLYENPETYIMVIIYSYDQQTCLLSDRGYSSPIANEMCTTWDFNLHSHGFIRYSFASINELAPANTPKSFIDAFKLLPKSINVYNIKNDFEALEIYNKNTIYQCYQNVFNADTQIYGI